MALALALGLFHEVKPEKCHFKTDLGFFFPPFLLAAASDLRCKSMLVTHPFLRGFNLLHLICCIYSASTSDEGEPLSSVNLLNLYLGAEMKLTQRKQFKIAEFSFFGFPSSSLFRIGHSAFISAVFALAGSWIRCLSSVGFSIFSSPHQSSPSPFSLNSPGDVSLSRVGSRGWTEVSKENKPC